LDVPAAVFQLHWHDDLFEIRAPLNWFVKQASRQGNILRDTPVSVVINSKTGTIGLIVGAVTLGYLQWSHLIRTPSGYLARAEFRRAIGVVGVVHNCDPELMNRFNSDTGIRMWRNALLGLISPRLLNRRKVIGEIPPRYAQASFNLRAAGGIAAEMVELS
jgi:hypothetical protein